MKRSKPHIRHLLVWLLLAWMPAHGQEAPDDSVAAAQGWAVPDSLPADLVIMPVVNYAEKGEAHSLLLPLLHQGLDRLGVTYLTAQDIRPLLRHHRIRSRGWIGLEPAAILHKETGASHLLLASWDIFRGDTNPEVGLSLRILDLENRYLVHSVSVGVTGADFTQAFGLGRVTDVAEVADIAMKRALEGLFPIPEYRIPRKSYRGCFQIALIPFDNFSDTPYAGDILTNVVLSRLMAEGYFVVEPGFVRELGLTLEVINRGGVDQRSARSILASFNACRVMTGAVETFSTARSSPTMSVPELEMGIRVMSPHDGNLYMMEEIAGAGDGKDGVFQGGRIHSLMTLTNQLLADFLDEVAANNREDILYGDRDP